MICDDVILVWIAETEMRKAVTIYGFTIEAIQFAIESAIGVLERSGEEFDDEDAEELMNKVINVGLTT